MFDMQQLKTDFERAVEKAMREEDNDVRYIEVECACGWEKRVQNKSWVTRYNLSQDIKQHVWDHETGKLPYEDVDINVKLITVEDLEEIDVTVTVQ